MKIQELAEKMGLSVHAVRFYEKEGLLDSRHVRREKNNYRAYTGEAIERLRLIRKFQGLGCSLAELKELFQDQDANAKTHQQMIEWMELKKDEIERKKAEYDQVLETLDWMIEYRKALMKDPEKAEAMLKAIKAVYPH
ncbi:DNA-binding transcriptional MerR regulator [Paenibacillus sp. BK033]|uniref:MerR family transcriptional regulator n=1 Tax=Paenibacillus sp. BK033 TaxID=2512133 RepID=UPI0010499AB8|nr:MerR family transcriptional regulator [Paenibacillus sp. BK033]TCM96942.1 DNA-binding transcriptional MerR regulator [Paenibacillus sp. BK033]